MKQVQTVELPRWSNRVVSGILQKDELPFISPYAINRVLGLKHVRHRGVVHDDGRLQTLVPQQGQVLVCHPPRPPVTRERFKKNECLR